MGRFCSALLAMGAAGACALAGTAGAADLPVPPSNYYPPAAYQPATYNWTGIYFGGHIGVNFLLDSVRPTAANPVWPLGSQVNYNPAGVFGGGQLGANYQFQQFVIGVEGTADGSTVSGSRVANSSIPGGTVRPTSAAHFYATAAGRFGYAIDTFLVFVKGGGAWMKAENFMDIQSNGVVVSTQNIGPFRTGFTVGTGLEYGMLEHLSARIEYDFYDFGSQNYVFNNLTATVPPATTPTATPIAVNIKSVTHVFTLGLNYRFN